MSLVLLLDRLVELDAKRMESEARKTLLRELRSAARKSCGNCRHWMCSRSCPRETNVNGFNRGPSINDAPCDKFQSSNEHLEWIRKYQAELATPPVKESMTVQKL